MARGGFGMVTLIFFLFLRLSIGGVAPRQVSSKKLTNQIVRSRVIS